MDPDSAGPDPSAIYGDDAAGRTGRFLEAIVDWFGRVTMWLLLAMVLLIGVNVVLRYFFSIGPVALQELEWHLMVPIALIGCSYGLRNESHVRVDILYDHFGDRTKAAVNLFSSVGLLVTAMLVFWLSLSFVDQAYRIDEGSPDPGGLPHRYLLKAFIPLGFALLALQALAHIILNSKRLLAR